MKDASEPVELADEKKALVRIWFYTPGTYYQIETVNSESERIRDVERRELHLEFSKPLFHLCHVHDPVNVHMRTEQFSKLHTNGSKDCRLLAEAEDCGLNFLLTYDTDFLKFLTNASNITKVIKPSDYWANLGIPRGAERVTRPHQTHPLYNQSWWLW